MKYWGRGGGSAEGVDAVDETEISDCGGNRTYTPHVVATVPTELPRPDTKINIRYYVFIRVLPSASVIL